MAPIFLKKKPEIEVVKVVLSPSKLKARQDFLSSGVPEEIKKQVALKKRLVVFIYCFFCFKNMVNNNRFAKKTLNGARLRSWVKLERTFNLFHCYICIVNKAYNKDIKKIR